MSDNILIMTGSGLSSETVAADEVTLVNGQASEAVKVQRVKVGYGVDSQYQDIDPSHPMPLAPTALQGTLHDGSGLIAAGGNPQDALATNANRKYLLVQNLSNQELWFAVGTDAVQSQPSIFLAPGGGEKEFKADFIPLGKVSVIGPTTGQAFTCTEGN